MIGTAIQGFRDFFLGTEGGITYGDLGKLTQRSRFSPYLPWRTYNPSDQTFTTVEKSTGLIWECVPVNFAGEKTINALHGLFRAGLPDRSIIQFTLYADNYIEPYLKAYKSLKTRPDQLNEEVTDAFCNFLRNGTKGLKNVAGIPVRVFRLFVSVKIPKPIANNPDSHYNILDVRTNIKETLRTAQLNPEPVTAEQLKDWACRFMNDRDFGDYIPFDEATDINEQIILADTLIKDKKEFLQIGDRVFRCITPKQFPPEMDPMKTNNLFGGIWGARDDGDQIRTPFLYTWNIFLDKGIKKELERKCSFVLGQKGFGSLSMQLSRKQDEYLWATDSMRTGTTIVRCIPLMWTWGSETETRESISRIKTIWENKGFIMQKDKGVLPQMFLSALPLGLVEDDKNLDNLERDFYLDENSTCVCTPVQADFCGGGSPYMFFVGRKGELITQNIFDPKAPSYNGFVAAGTGAGKSVLVNNILDNYYAANAMGRIVDIGDSYQKQAHMKNAKYLDFTPESDICINPFANVSFKQDEDGLRDRDEDLATITSIVHQMIVSATDKLPGDDPETAITLISDAVIWAYNQQFEKAEAGEEFIADIDTVYEYLITYPKYVREGGASSRLAPMATDHLQFIANLLAKNLEKFTSQGQYGKWFNGKSNFDISKDEYVVLELKSLAGKGPLFKVVILQILNAVTFDLYILGLKDRTRKRFVVFDESWQFLKGDNILLKKVIESGYRRARKANGSFIVITQSIKDLKQFGDIGDVIKSNAAFQYFLQSPDYEEAKHEKIMDIDDFTLDLLKTVQTVPYKYSEVYMKTPFGRGIARLILDPVSYYTYTTTPSDVAEMTAMVNSGKTWKETIFAMAEKYGHLWAQGAA